MESWRKVQSVFAAFSVPSFFWLIAFFLVPPGIIRLSWDAAGMLILPRTAL